MHHAIERARERYSLDLTNADLKEIATRIGAGHATLAARSWRPDRHPIYVVTFRGVCFKAVYDARRNEIVTIVPLRHA